MEILITENLTYKEIAKKLFPNSELDRQKLNVVATTVKRLKVRGLIKPTGMIKDRCAIYSPINRENVIFIKDNEFLDYKEGYYDFQSLFSEISRLAKEGEFSKQKVALLQRLYKEKLDMNRIARNISRGDLK